MIPNHLLILGPPNSGKLRIAKTIAQDYEAGEYEPDQSHSGIIIKTSVITKYYEMKLTIMIDEYLEKSHGANDKLAELSKWYEDFQSDDCEELREVIDGFIFTVNMASDSVEYIEMAMDVLATIRQSLGGHDWKGFICVVGSSPNDEPIDEDLVELIEDAAITSGFEFINLQSEGVNEYKEKQGKDRIKELIECHEWSNMDMLTDKPDRYEKSKLDKLESMTVGLLDEHKQDMELEEIFNKLSVSKQVISNLPPDKRESYANKVLEEIIDFI
ncbi:uncharacterized protein SPAPADRAFT_58759 [Spathaspora passalidarum NRRL Y-27907]|uniref:Increased recombination centers protein 6 n=1 Tax=Spathaspora passalidarum (strain NRRL Y-27907 / 11-Y1) TaxID=619300 RepID=G3AHA3_SPAPN|nr:uncharacterized protein SPAPADRAFT_58759 [Spathaspora passalidarum NRRL Y-27907]EGW35532.1 hypothetical protein SPAPADRAFT_58759 [Spathaspora passalidarum NRRL Y-27907]